jgi:hypothetical protein
VKRVLITKVATAVAAAVAVGVAGCGVNEKRVGTTSGNQFVACFSKTNPTTVAAVDQAWQRWATGKPILGCTATKTALSTKERHAAYAIVGSFRTRIDIREQAANRKKAQEAACKAAVSPVLAALQTLQGRVTAGVSEDEYSTQVGAAQGVANQQASAEAQTFSDCQPVVDNLNQALSTYVAASSDWIACLQDINQDSCVGDSLTGTKVQIAWTAADGSISDAQSDLGDVMKGVSPPPASSSNNSLPS